METTGILIFLTVAFNTDAAGPSGQYSFQNKGKLTNVIEMAHLVIPVDFTELQKQIDIFCESVRSYWELMKTKEGNYLLGYTSNRLGYTAKARCSEIEDSFNSIKSIWTANLTAFTCLLYTSPSPRDRG